MQILSILVRVPLGTSTPTWIIKDTVTSEDTNWTFYKSYTCEDQPNLVTLQNVTRVYYSNQIGYYAKFKFDIKYPLSNINVGSVNYRPTLQSSMKSKLGEYFVSFYPSTTPTLDSDMVLIDMTITSNLNNLIYNNTFPSFIKNVTATVESPLVQPTYPLSPAFYPCKFYHVSDILVSGNSETYFGLEINDVLYVKENLIANGNPSRYQMVLDQSILTIASKNYSFVFYDNLIPKRQSNGLFTTVTSSNSEIFEYVSQAQSSILSQGPSGLFVFEFMTQYIVNININILMTYRSINRALIFNFPSWIASGNFKTNTKLQIPVVVPYQFNNNPLKVWGTTVTVPGPNVDNTLPVLLDFKWISLGAQKYIMHAEVEDLHSGFYTLDVYNDNMVIASMDYRDLVSGDIYNGVYQKFIDFLDIRNPFRAIDNIIIFDVAANRVVNIMGYYGFKPIPVISNYVENIVQNYNLYDVTSVRFAFNDIDLSNIGAQNAIYFNISNANKNSGVAIRFFINVRNTDPYKYVFYGKWHEPSGMFSINFELPSRIFTGQVEYSIWYPDLTFSSINLLLTLGETSQLRVKSNNADSMPPIFKQLTAIPSNSVIANDVPSEIGWNFNVLDSVGIKKMIITVFSDVDGSDFNKTFTPTGTNALVSVRWNVSTPCMTEVYRIKYVYLEDLNGIVSEYRYGKLSNGISPFIQILNSNQFEITVSCTPMTASTPPVIISMSSGSLPSYINTGQRDLSISFCIQGSQGISDNPKHLPYCLLSGLYNQRYQIRSTQTNYTGTTACYLCNGNLPYMFGSPFNNDNVFLSIYGYTDKLLNFGGLSSFDLKQNPNFIYKIPIVYSLNPHPVIVGATRMTNLGGDLTIYGHNFGTNTSSVSARVITSVDPILYSVSYVENVVAVIKGIQANLHHLEVVIVVGFESSNTFIVPIENELVVPYTPPIIPTQCPGTPLCGGPNNGDCIANKCQCKDPWIGNDCLSQNIIIKPTINTTSPDTGNDYKTDLDGKDVSLKTLVSIVSLNEINKDSSINFSYNFTNWKYTNLTSSDRTKNFEEYLYETDVPYGGINTTVKVTLKYFHNKDTVEFAGETLDILPSTLKYQISISPFKFQSSLNTLQLVMSASIQSDTNDYSCTYQEQGNSPDSDADYVKLQVNEHSLYGRFIKRAIIDNRIQTISNTFQNGESQSNHIQNQVAINIPNFQYLVIMDPDYSVLIDSQKASDQSTSTCGQPSEDKGLTKTQLIGIIIGSVAFGIIAIIVISYFLYKKNSTIRVIALKLKEIKIMK
ncbi:EGF-like domain-containing protein [Tieghemostelium lacteum]|uniref:EGF-like domain-containing protein n=1 Tax=Tieghemostelium lacteum TaxID=361077 RepID=A0A151ZCU8_TIELA|nr:EGF-like domain-containing protein [Tieghemostelium lacteum]|eukprot:KYQ91778.1 EGF-like domain-containing protein [Tieghemostelium lacteum]